MSTFDNRKDAFEGKHAYDQEQQFKLIARRNHRLGLWAAELLGIDGEEAEEYARSVIKSDFEEPGDDDVLRKVVGDLAENGTSEEEVRSQMDTLLAEVIAAAGD